MAQKLSVQIELEGATEIARQLESLGEAGKTAFKEIGAAAEKVGGFDQLDPTEVTQKLEDMGITGEDAINKIQDAVEQAGNLEGIVSSVRALENGFGALGKVIRPLGGEIRKVQQAASALYGVVGPIGAAVAGSFVVAGAAIAATNKLTIDFAQSIAKISAEAIKLGLSFEVFDAARKKLEGFGISAAAISAGFEHIQQTMERLRLEQIVRDAQAVKDSFFGDAQALRRLQQAAQEFTPVGQAAAEALVKLGRPIPGVAQRDIEKYGTELAKLKALIERVTGQKIDFDFSADPAQQIEEIIELLRLLPDGAERSALALRFLGEALGTETIQRLRLMEGSLSPVEANALRLVGAINQLQSAFARFGSVTFAPFVTAEINAVTTALQALQAMVENFSWGTFINGATAAGNALKYFSIQGYVALGLQWAWDLSGFDALIEKIAQATRSWLEYFGIASKAGGTPLPGGAPIGGPGGGIGGAARGGMIGGRGTGTSDSNLAWLSRGEYIMPARAVARPGVLSFLESLRRSGRIPGFASGGIVGGGGTSTFQTTFENMAQAIQQNTEAINSQSTVIMELGRIIENMVQTVSSALSARGSARGGLLGGRGTGTSDSNLAWVSRGEHVMPARAVRQPGVLAFLEALRRSGGNLADVLDGMGRFALGGMVPRAIPAFATGGLAGGNNVTIQFPGLPPISGLRASSGVVDQLHKAAALAQVRSGGRKPSRYS